MSFLGKFSGMIVRCVPTKEREESHHEKTKMNTNRMVMLSMFVAVGVVISPILRVEGMCPTAHLVNIVCAVFLGPWYSLLCATMIGVIRMLFMGIPPLALTGAVFGAFLSGVFTVHLMERFSVLCLGRFSEQESSDHLYPIRSWHF